MWGCPRWIRAAVRTGPARDPAAILDNPRRALGFGGPANHSHGREGTQQRLYLLQRLLDLAEPDRQLIDGQDRRHAVMELADQIVGLRRDGREGPDPILG